MADAAHPHSPWRKRVIGAIVAVIFGWLAASWLMTGIMWDGAFPTMKFRLRLVDRDGHPVKGATLKVRGEGRPLKYTDNYPITNLFANPTSDNDGWIEFYHVFEGLEYGGFSWKPFFLFDAGFRTPRFWLEFEHSGQKLGECSYNDLIKEWWEEAEIKTRETWPKANGEFFVADDYHLCEQTVTVRNPAK